MDLGAANGLAVVGRRRYDLEERRAWVERRIANSYQQSTILQELQQIFDIKISIRTLRRRLQSWEIQARRRPDVVDTPLLRARVAHCFFILRASDESVCRILDRDGFVIGPTRMARMRKDMGLYKRVPSEHREVAEREMMEVLRRELQDGNMEDLGRRMLYEYMRMRYSLVSRDRLYHALGVLNPNGVQRRRTNAKQHRGVVVLPGPNAVWLMDAYCKLEYFGFEVYACTDAYSRYMSWVYVGITSRTQVSVWAQYVETVRAGKVIPLVLQSNMGGETRSAADAHLTLRRQLDAGVGEEALTFDDCFRYGTSKVNQRIETWWRQQKASTARWR
ncbi:hypothetical protein LTR95_014827 [Oleoguttula sp. CCFEE 5521]